MEFNKVNELCALKRKAKAGWRCFYQAKEANHLLGLKYIHLQKIMEKCRQDENVDISFLKSQFLELYDEVGKLVSCPVCFELLTKTNTHIPLCGHLVCFSCKSKMDKCPICRK